jgi:DNA-binding MarR family transcriptional regulator
MLDRMERDGMVERIPDPKNRRQIFVRITGKVRSFFAEYERVSERINKIFYKGFSPGEIRESEGKLKKIITNLEEELK